MTIQKVNIGNVVNDGLGDDLPTAFKKVNANFDYIEENYTISGSNLAGNRGFKVYRDTVASQLRFRNLVPGRRVALEETSDAIIISSTQEDSFIQIATDNGTVIAQSSPYLTIRGQTGNTVIAEGSTITVKSSALTSVVTDYGRLSVENNSIQIVGSPTVTTRVSNNQIVIDTKTFTSVLTEDGNAISSSVTPVLEIVGENGVDVTVKDNKVVIKNSNSKLNVFDFGSTVPAADAVQLLLQVSNVDFNSPGLSVDFSKID